MFIERIRYKRCVDYAEVIFLSGAKCLSVIVVEIFEYVATKKKPNESDGICSFVDIFKFIFDATVNCVRRSKINAIFRRAKVHEKDYV